MNSSIFYYTYLFRVQKILFRSVYKISRKKGIWSIRYENSGPGGGVWNHATQKRGAFSWYRVWGEFILRVMLVNTRLHWQFFNSFYQTMSNFLTGLEVYRFKSDNKTPALIASFFRNLTLLFWSGLNQFHGNSFYQWMFFFF